MKKNKEKIFRVIEHAYNESKAYNRLYQGKDINIISNLDIIDQNFILDNCYNSNSDIITKKNEGYNIFSTSGSSGKRKIVYRSFEESRISSKLIYKGIRPLLNSGDRIAFLLHYGDLWAGAITFGQAFQMTDSALYSFGADINTEVMVENLVKFKINTLVCVPAQALALANFVLENNIDIKVSKIITGGERLFHESKLTLSSAFKADFFYSLGYAMNETGPIGYQCKHLGDSEFHIHDSHIYLEIVDDKGKSNVDIGSIVLTNLYFYLMPIVRYKTGDIGKVVFKKCPCGSSDKIIELLGRDDKKFKIGDDLISLSSIDYEIKKTLGLSTLYTVLVSTEKSLDKITITIYGENHSAAHIEKLIERLYYISNLKEQHDKGMIFGIYIIMEKLKTLKTNNISRKIINFLDSRN